MPSASAPATTAPVRSSIRSHSVVSEELMVCDSSRQGTIQNSPRDCGDWSQIDRKNQSALVAKPSRGRARASLQLWRAGAAERGEQSRAEQNSEQESREQRAEQSTDSRAAESRAATEGEREREREREGDQRDRVRCAPTARGRSVQRAERREYGGAPIEWKQRLVASTNAIDRAL